MYRNTFNTEFNLGFGSPKSDTCSVFDRNGGDADHKKHATHAKKQDKEAQGNENIYFITFDLQKTLPLPKLSTSIAFYLRQLWLYNLGVHFVSQKTSGGFFQLWTEDEGGRGSEEIPSALLASLDAMALNGGHLPFNPNRTPVWD